MSNAIVIVMTIKDLIIFERTFPKQNTTTSIILVIGIVLRRMLDVDNEAPLGLNGRT